MTITEAIAQLVALQEKHGDVNVYFDCPFCERSFAPNVIKPVAVHLSSKETRGAKAERP